MIGGRNSRGHGADEVQGSGEEISEAIPYACRGEPCKL